MALMDKARNVEKIFTSDKPVELNGLDIHERMGRNSSVLQV